MHRQPVTFALIAVLLFVLPGGSPRHARAETGDKSPGLFDRMFGSDKKEAPKPKAKPAKKTPKKASKKAPKKARAKTTKPKKRRKLASKEIAAPPQKPSDSLGTDLSNFGAQMIMRLDRLIKKKSFSLLGDPWTIQGIPLLFWVRHRGSHLGVHIMMNNIRRQDPYKAQLKGQVLASDEGQLKHYLQMDFPRAINGNFRIRTKVALDRDLTQNYFGISNETRVDPAVVRNYDVSIQNIRHQPSFTLEILKHFGKNLQIGPVLGLKWSTITAPPGSLLAAQRPSGIDGGRTHYVGLAIIDDRTDFEPYPSRGSAHEIFLTYYHRFIGSDYNFFRGTYNFRKYWPLHRTLTLAHRTFFETVNGNVPYYELGATGGLNRTLGFGGSRFIRGYFENQFIGNVKTAFNFEFRWDPLTFDFARQVFSVGFVPFFDIGRVWVTDTPLKFGPWHASTGWGVRAIWNSRFILRGDFALTNQGTNFFVELGNSF